MNAILMVWAIGCLLFGLNGYLDSRDSKVVGVVLMAIGAILFVWALHAPPS